MVFIVPMVFIFIILMWFLIVAIMDKDKRMIIRMSIIVITYSFVVGGGMLMLIQIYNQFK